MPEAEGALAPEVPAADAVPEQPTGDAAPPPAVTKPDDTEKPKGVQKRLDELTRNWREEQRRTERLERLLERAIAGEPKVSQPEPEKGLADFGYDEAKFKAYLKSEAVRTATAETSRAAPDIKKQVQEELKHEARLATLQSRETEFSKGVEDYDEVTAIGDPRNPNWACSEAMADVILESDEGPALKYYLAKNPDEALKLASLTPGAAGRAMAMLETRLVTERKKAAEKPVTQAPPPVPKVEGSGDSGRVDPTTPDSDSLSDAEWLRKREKQVQAKRK